MPPGLSWPSLCRELWPEMNLLLSERQASALARALRVLRERQRPPTLCAAAVECRALSLPALMPTKRAACL